MNHGICHWRDPPEGAGEFGGYRTAKPPTMPAEIPSQWGKYFPFDDIAVPH